ncbi:hypothetical protein [Flexibacterium corallicola]|uniref:hypothetical protein n=1 Tax=Flexibacterium corallicola TaxID=3037259 RepID=UPI00286F6194|nr:hypothetical protein [Pseudovibrio sp. M1P-2-3]
MIRVSQILSGLFVLILGGAGITTMLFPELVNEPTGFNATTAYGLTNVRTLGAPTLALAVIALLGLVRRDWMLILPASLYFFLNFSARVISVFNEGYDPVMVKGLVITGTLFVLSQIAVHTFRHNREY